MRLQLVGLYALHVLADGHHAGNVHCVLRQGALLKNTAKCVLIHGVVNNLPQPGADVRVIAIAHGLNKQVTQWTVIKCHFSEYVKDLAAQRCAFFFELLE